MISEFGQTPAQLFDENQPHPAREVIQPVPSEPLPGYSSSTSQSPEISHTLVHILLEVSASESMHSVLSSPQPKPQPAPPHTPAFSAPSPLALCDQVDPRSPSSPGATMNPQANGVSLISSCWLESIMIALVLNKRSSVSCCCVGHIGFVAFSSEQQGW